MDINKKYKKLTGNQFSSLNTSISAFLPTVTENDYTKGYIIRFFTQKVNDPSSPIYEVSNINFQRLNNSVLYNTTSLRWRVTGTIDPVRNPRTNRVTDRGIRESNRISVELASTSIRNLKMYLPNLVQFKNKS